MYYFSKINATFASKLRKTPRKMKNCMFVADAVYPDTSSDMSIIYMAVMLAVIVILLTALTAYVVYRFVRNHEQRRLEEQKAFLLKEEDKRVSDMKQRILTEASQELLTPITLIIGPLQQLASEPLADSVKPRIQLLLRNAQLLLHQVNMLPVGVRPGSIPSPAVEMQMLGLGETETSTPNVAPVTPTATPVTTPTAPTTPSTPVVVDDSVGIDDSNAAAAVHLSAEDGKAEGTDKQGHRFTMLMVDDSPDMCRFVHDYFRGVYNVITANNGEEAVTCLQENDNIDLVVSDVTMPKMDGLELCKYVKSDLRWSHIPVILLTGRTDGDMEVEGLKLGADDYITKPFNVEMLRLRVKNLIEKKESRQRLFREKMDVSPSEITITSVDEQFIQKATKICEEHIADTEFSVEVLGHELNMSRTYLYKKLMNITGKGPAEFIRIIRLKRGKQYLEQSALPIAEIATALGYSSSKRFSENFKAEFGMSPSEYMRKMKVKIDINY